MLDHLSIDTLRDRVERDLGWPDVPREEISIGAALEFAAALHDWRQRPIENHARYKAVLADEAAARRCEADPNRRELLTSNLPAAKGERR